MNMPGWFPAYFFQTGYHAAGCRSVPLYTTVHQCPKRPCAAAANIGRRPCRKSGGPSHGKSGRLRMRNGPFWHAIRAVRQRKTAHTAKQAANATLSWAVSRPGNATRQPTQSGHGGPPTGCADCPRPLSFGEATWPTQGLTGYCRTGNLHAGWQGIGKSHWIWEPRCQAGDRAPTQ